MDKLSLLDAWSHGAGKFFAGNSAQDFLGAGQRAMASAGSCGSSCGANDEGKDKEEPKPGACGSSCGAGDNGKDKEKPKPGACGSSCGAGDKK
jgi:ACGX-repeat protein